MAGKHMYTIDELEAATTAVVVHDEMPLSLINGHAVGELRRIEHPEAIRIFTCLSNGKVAENRYYL